MKKVIALIFLVMILFIGIWGLTTEIREYSKGAEEYQELEQFFIVNDSMVTKEIPKENSTQTYIETVPNVNFDELKKINEDIIAWIYIPNTGISYPVVQAQDNNYYVTHTFKGRKNKTGAIFLDTYNSADFSDKNSIIYGHNLQNGKMFSGLKKFLQTTYIENHNEFIIYTPSEEAHYRVFAVFKTDKNSEVYKRNFADEEAFNMYLDNVKEKSLYKFNEEVEIDNVVTLSTCTNVDENERIVLIGVKVISEEIVEN